jgi:pimeloyl-ACP methyl ester carboxylesterase
MGAPRVLYYGGNGHSSWRLSRVRALGAPFEIDEAPYPGFEDRPRAPDLEGFLAVLGDHAGHAELAFGTGIGGLFLLCLRSQGLLLDTPLVLHAPVLWGLERRLMPRLLRLGPLRRLLPSLFMHKQFVAPLDDADRAAFFDGYARCSAFTDFFDWLGPSLLRELERRFAERPAALDRVRVWWGGQDRVVTPAELQITEAVLGVRWPLTVIDDWAHYPMIEAPESFVRVLAAALEGG